MLTENSLVKSAGPPVRLGNLIDLGLNFVIRLRKGIYKKAIEMGGHSYDKLEKKALKKGYSQAIFKMGGHLYKIEMWPSSKKNQSFT